MSKEFGRVVIIAPTRSTCLNISVVLENGNIPGTLLVREKGTEIAAAVTNLANGGFGVVAGTGTGKTVAIRAMAKQIIGELKVDVVTRENEATPYTWSCNVLVITPGVALHWFKNGVIKKNDLIVIDEIHQTSEHLELSMALAKREGNTVVWMSATIDASVYKNYLNAQSVIECSAFDPTRKAKAEAKYGEVDDFLRSNVQKFVAEKRAVAVFVPTREMAERLSKQFASTPGLNTDYYHGGEKAEKLRQFLKGEVPKPFMIFMTSAGASSLNIAGLDTVVIVDQMFTENIHSGVKVLEKTYLDNNTMLQMGGRVNGRAVNGEIYILSSRSIDFHSLKPEVPRFQLGGDLQHVALVCARLGVEASELDLITKIDQGKYLAEVARFRERGVIEKDSPELTHYGKRIERLPVSPAWAEMLVHAEDSGNEQLLDITIVSASIESLYSLMRKDAKLSNFRVKGSDHLTAYNIIASAMNQFGFIRRGDEKEYAFNGDYVKRRGNDVEKGAFAEWCDEFGFSGKAIKEVAIAMKSIYRQLGLDLLNPEGFAKIESDTNLHIRFVELLARVQSFDFVQSQRNSTAGAVWAAQHSVADADDAVLGVIRFWTDKRGIRRATIEGTEVSSDLLDKYAQKTPQSIYAVDADGVRIEFAQRFAGERLSSSTELVPDAEVPIEFEAEAANQFRNWLVRQMLVQL